MRVKAGRPWLGFRGRPAHGPPNCALADVSAISAKMFRESGNSDLGVSARRHAGGARYLADASPEVAVCCLLVGFGRERGPGFAGSVGPARARISGATQPQVDRRIRDFREMLPKRRMTRHPDPGDK